MVATKVFTKRTLNMPSNCHGSVRSGAKVLSSTIPAIGSANATKLDIKFEERAWTQTEVPGDMREVMKTQAWHRPEQRANKSPIHAEPPPAWFGCRPNRQPGWLINKAPPTPHTKAMRVVRGSSSPKMTRPRRAAAIMLIHLKASTSPTGAPTWVAKIENRKLHAPKMPLSTTHFLWLASGPAMFCLFMMTPMGMTANKHTRAISRK
mmetsp:Transcript_64135/g.134847  ORF Transcript_64135/g.134847 Transcript_64135/m.134847 type:complete len:207 (+) Transcript_64135:459-1079(+)